MKNETVRIFSKKFDETREQIIDIDAVLPDYYPEVNQILKCSAVLSVESVTNAGDKLSVAGIMQTSVIFTGADGKLSVFDTSQKYTKIVQCDGLSDGDKFFVSQDVSQLNYKATAPRRIEIRASAAVRTVVFTLKNSEFVSDFEDETIEQSCECFDSFEVEGAEGFSFEMTDTVKLPDGVTGESELINASGELFIRETKVIKNKVMLKGSCAAEFITVQADGTVKKFNADIPFTEVRELYGADENDICSVTASCKNLRLALKAMNGGGEAAFSADIDGVVFTAKKTSYTVATDAFSLRGDSELYTSSVEIIGEIVSIDTTANVSLDAETYDSSTTELLAAFADNIKYVCSKTDTESKLNGTCTLNAVLKNADGKIFIIGRTAGFECQIPDANDRFLSVSCSRVTAELLTSEKVGFSASFGVKGFGLSFKRTHCVTECRLAEKSETAHSGGIALYYAHAGEKLWNIAKENKCRVSLLRELNGIESDETTESRVVIFPLGV